MLSFSMAIDRASMLFAGCPPNMEKRMIFLAGSLVDLFGTDAVDYGSNLKGLGVAVDVVNFYLEDKPKNTRMELDAFVEAANSNDNSHIEHVKPRSSIPEVLDKSILRKTLSFSTRRAKRQNHAAGDDKHVRSEAFSLEREGEKLGKRKREAIYP
uniref:uncharacterized protein LOC122602322 n=1 Tax=Erigeron canadensis TaxID=72917 RepID=UPI001CB94FBD|nr:uncharacterized protein LOC122602322 [Erigeron canadensis]